MKHPEFLSGHKINELVWEGVVVAVVVVKGVRVWLSFGYVVIVLVEVIEVVMGGGVYMHSDDSLDSSYPLLVGAKIVTAKPPRLA